MSEILTGAQIICRTLAEAGVDTLFGYPGGAIMPFYHALPEYPRLRHVLVRHEQAAAHAADGYARASGRLGVCVATSGPGATNLVTGLAAAHMDSSPVLAITGQVARSLLGRDAFQETDVVGVTLPVTKHSYLVQDVTELAGTLREAAHLALDGRPGPVLVDVPKDVQTQRTAWAPTSGVHGSASAELPASLGEDIRRAAAMMDASERPLLMLGHGVILAGAYREVRALAERAGLPVITTLLGISAFPHGHPLHLGMPGMHGEVHVNRAIQQADLILGIGLRFDDRVTGCAASFAPRAQIIHVDLDPAEIGRTVRVDLGLVGDARLVTRLLLDRVTPRQRGAWMTEIQGKVRRRSSLPAGGLSAEGILQAIHAVTGGRCTIVSDVGQHQMWTAKLYPYGMPNSHITSGGLGAMGFAVPAALGVRLARPGQQVWAIVGDGGFQMNMAEIATMVQEGIPVKMAVFNNGYLGMVRQWQQFFHERRYSCTPIWSPDYLKLAEAYGIPAWRVREASALDDALSQAAAVPGPALVELLIEREANVLPMVPPGASLSETVEAEQASAAVA